MGRSRFVVTLAAVLILGSACAEDGGPDAASGTGSDQAATATGPTTPTGSTTTDAGMQDGGGGGRYDYGTDDDGGGDGGDADVVADNFAFAPAEIELDAGARISVKNANGSTPHTFTIEGTDVDLELDPGEIEEATLTLDPGAYAFLCRFHPQMTGTLTLT